MYPLLLPRLLLFTYTTISLLCSANGYNVLMFVPGLSNSHVMFDFRLANLIADRGHRVTVVVEDYFPGINKGKLRPSVNEIRIDPLKGSGIQDASSRFKVDIYAEHGLLGETWTTMKVWFTLKQMMAHGCRNMASDRALIDRLRAEQFDLAIVDIAICPFGLVKLLGIPGYVWMTSGLLSDPIAALIGAPVHPSYMPGLMSLFGDRMTFWQRTVNFLQFVSSQLQSRWRVIPQLNEVFRKYHGQDFPDLAEIAARSSLCFVNSEEFLDFPRPILHKIVYIGGIGLLKPRPLEHEWQQVMDSSEDGVVLFSFGSIANTTTMPLKWKEAFLTAFSKFPDVTFIWKFEGDLLPEEKLPKNVNVVKWVPQNDLFGHPKTKAFIAHSGFNSLLETSINGIPLIAIPLFLDQFGNAKRAERQGTAVVLQKWQISNAENVENALRQILYNASCKRNAEHLSGLIRKKPVKSAELVVDWVEYVAENRGLPSLEPASIDLNWFQYLSLDIVAFLALVTCSILIGCYFIVKFSFIKATKLFGGPKTKIE